MCLSDEIGMRHQIVACNHIKMPNSLVHQFICTYRCLTLAYNVQVVPASVHEVPRHATQPAKLVALLMASTEESVSRCLLTRAPAFLDMLGVRS